MTQVALAAPGDAVIIVANKSYRSGVPPVEFADRDADEIERAATDGRVLNVPRLGVARLNDMTQGDAAAWFQRDGTPGRELVDHLRRAAGTRKDGTIYFYYTGHGISARSVERGTDELHLVLTDTRTNDVGGTALSITAIQLALNAAKREIMPKGRVVLMVDACFSGVGRNDEPLWPGSRMIGAGAKPKVQAEDRTVILAASAVNEPAWSDAVRRQGAFTDALLDGLYGRAAGEDGRITAENLHRFISARVSERLARVNRSQTPTIDGDTAAPIATLKLPYPVRDPQLVARLTRQCAVMRVTTDVNELQEFMKSICHDDCPCRADVETRMRTEAACAEEAADLEALIKKGPTALAQIVALRDHLVCPAVQTRATATLAHLEASKTAMQSKEPAKEPEATDDRKARTKVESDAPVAATDAPRKADATTQPATARGDQQAGRDRGEAIPAERLGSPAIAAVQPPSQVTKFNPLALFNARAVPSFDCKDYARKSQEQRLPQTDILCIHVEAAAADNKMGMVFRTYRDRFDTQTKRAVVERQAQWVAQRNVRCPVSWDDVADERRRAEAVACLLAATNARQTELSQWTR